jgi:hypothetical protein
VSKEPPGWTIVDHRLLLTWALCAAPCAGHCRRLPSFWAGRVVLKRILSGSPHATFLRTALVCSRSLKRALQPEVPTEFVVQADADNVGGDSGVRGNNCSEGVTAETLREYGVNGERVATRAGIWKFVAAFDERGNQIEIAYYGGSGTRLLVVRRGRDRRGGDSRGTHRGLSAERAGGPGSPDASSIAANWFPQTDQWLAYRALACISQQTFGARIVTS